MAEESAALPLRKRTRVNTGLRKPANWMQLLRFGAVGGSGYVVNIIIFTLAVHALDLGHLVAATVAFLVAVSNNFLLNRHWTFDARGGHAGFQAARFFAVSLCAFAFNLVVLELLVTKAGLPEVPSQALAIVAATPLSFLGNKLWSFSR